jgi:hypothetical protein
MRKNALAHCGMYFRVTKGIKVLSRKTAMIHHIFKTVAIGLFIAATTLSTKTAHAAMPPTSIKIDGNLNDINWQHGRLISAFQTLKNETPQAATSGTILTDANYLYLSFRCAEPQMDKLQDSPKPRDGSLWNNDCIEIFVAPYADTQVFYHLIVDAAGQVYDALNSGGKEDLRYDLSVTAKTRKEQNGWTLEMAVPLSNLGLSRARAPLMNFCRERKPAGELTSWHGLFAQPDTWQQMKLALHQRRDIDVRDWNFGDAPGYGDNTAVIRFVPARTAPLKVLLYAEQNNYWTLKNSKKIQTAAHQEMRISLPYTLLPANKPHKVRWVLADDNKTVFSAVYRLNLPDGALVAALKSPYYYSDESTGFLQLQIFLSPSSIRSGSIRLTVKSPDGVARQIKKIYPLQASMTAAIDISSWQNGDGAAFAELLVNGKILAHQRSIIMKRSGPFSKSTFPSTRFKK